MMSRVMAWTALCVTFSASVQAQTFLLSDHSRELAHSYLSCVTDEATKLEAIGETVSDTVELAKSACADFKLRVASGVLRDIDNRLPNSAAETKFNITKQLREAVEEQVTEEARLRLARFRAEKANAPD